jgi:hypothetical protein
MADPSPMENDRFLGTTMELQPIYGWGWRPRFPWEDMKPSEGLPRRIRFRLDSFFHGVNGIIGCNGRVEPDDKLFGGYFIHIRWGEMGQIDLGKVPFIGRAVSLRRSRPFGTTFDDERADSVIEDDTRWDGWGGMGRPGFRFIL